MADFKNTVLMKTPSIEGAEIRAVYFLGIGGIGMSNIARFFHSKGVAVSGYDKTSTSLTRQLEKEGMVIHYEDKIDHLPKEIDLVIFTPAIPKDHKGLQYYLQNNYKVVKRSEALQMITESSLNICVAGTHGKTTVTSMVAHMLRDTGYGCNAFLGGISVNYETNFWSSNNNVCVVEADEYDRSFLKLSPDVAILTAMDADHLDIYGTKEAVEEAFIDFTGKIKAGGLLISKFGLKRTSELKADRHLTYSLQNDNADVYAANIRMMDGSYEFDVMMKDNMLDNVVLHMGGMHNIENVIAAIAAVSSLGIENDKIKAAVESYRGVKRRFEYVVKNINIVFIDDYAHHPEELNALIKGAKSLFRQRKCTVIFQPHLFTRTRDFADGFAASLDEAHEVILLPIYPARELPIEGVSSEMILDKMKMEQKRIMDKEEIKNWIEQHYAKEINKDFGALLITAGAGDIDVLIEPIKQNLLNV